LSVSIVFDLVEWVLLPVTMCLLFYLHSAQAAPASHFPHYIDRTTDFVAPHPTESKEYEQICNGRKFSVAIGLYYILEENLGESWECSE